MEPPNLRRLFADICRGYTKTKWNGADLYIKHFSHFDQTDIDIERDRYFEIATNKGVPTLEKKLELLDDHGVWTRKDEKRLNDLKEYIDRLQETRKKQFVEEEKKNLDRSLAKYTQEHNDLYVKRYSLIGLTSEKYADQKIQTHYLVLSLFEDQNLELPLFDIDSIDDLDEEEINLLMDLYLKYVDGFSHTNVKKIAVSSFFTSYFYLSEDNKTFFNKAISSLTFYQLNLLSYGIYFKNIAQHYQIPSNIKDDPDAIEAYVQKTETMKKIAEKTPQKEGARVGVVGGSNEEVKALNRGLNLTPDILNKEEVGHIEQAVKMVKA